MKSIFYIFLPKQFLGIWGLMITVICLASTSCQMEEKSHPHLPSKRYTATNIQFDSLPIRECVYVPIYSEIYYMSGKNQFLLTSTLSVRNTSLTDTLYVSTVDYYSSEGNRIRSYIEQPILLHPMESVEFVVENDEREGGAGANFMVFWGSHQKITPVIQAVMVGQGISFLTEGVTVESKEKTVTNAQQIPEN